MEGETKAEAMHRLRTDGRWAEATEYRNQMRKQFKGDGKTRAEAGEREREAARVSGGILAMVQGACRD